MGDRSGDGWAWAAAVLAGAVLLPPGAWAAPDSLATCIHAAEPATALSACVDASHDPARPAGDRAVAYANSGAIRFNQHDADGATADFRAALALDPESDTALAARADTELAAGDYDAARADAGKAVALRPDGHADSLVVLGTLEEGDARVQYMNRAIALVPGYAAAYAGRSKGYEQEGQYDSALADLHKAASLDGSLPGLGQRFELLHVERGDARVEAGQVQPAIEDFTQALAVNPDSTLALNRRANAYDLVGGAASAVADLDRAIQLDPANAELYGNRGTSYVLLGQDDRALPDLNKAIAAGDPPLAFLVIRGKLHQRHSDPAAARADFRSALDQLPPDSPERPSIQAMLGEVGG